MKKVLLQMSLLLITGFTNAQNVVPLDISFGKNADVVVEAFPMENHVTKGVDNEQCALYVEGIRYGGKGLPQTMPIISDNGVYYYIDYTEKNALQLDNNNYSGTLELAAPVKTQQIYVLFAVGNGPSLLGVKINYADGSNSYEEYTVDDWAVSSGENLIAVKNLDVLKRKDISDDTSIESIFLRKSGWNLGYHSLKEMAITTTSSKRILSIDFSKRTDFGEQKINILALSTGISPIEIAEGFTCDVIAEGYPASNYTDAEIDGVGAGCSNVFFVDGVTAPLEGGLPSNGIINAPSGAKYTIDYNNLNAVRVIPEDGETTITFASSAKAKSLYLLGFGFWKEHGTEFNVQVDYEDGTKEEHLMLIPDWWKGRHHKAISNLNLLYDGRPNYENDVSLFEIPVPVKENNKDIKGLTFQVQDGGIVILGVASNQSDTSIENWKDMSLWQYDYQDRFEINNEGADNTIAFKPLGGFEFASTRIHVNKGEIYTLSVDYSGPNYELYLKHPQIIIDKEKWMNHSDFGAQVMIPNWSVENNHIAFDFKAPQEDLYITITWGNVDDLNGEELEFHFNNWKLEKKEYNFRDMTTWTYIANYDGAERNVSDRFTIYNENDSNRIWFRGGVGFEKAFCSIPVEKGKRYKVSVDYSGSVYQSRGVKPCLVILPFIPYNVDDENQGFQVAIGEYGELPSEGGNLHLEYIFTAPTDSVYAFINFGFIEDNNSCTLNFSNWNIEEISEPESDVIAPGIYYLYNKGTDKYLNKGYRYDNEASPSNEEFPIIFSNLGNGYLLDTQIMDTNYGDRKHFLGCAYEVASNGNFTTWISYFAQTWYFLPQEDGSYAMTFDGTHFLANTYTDNPFDITTDPSDERAHWELKTIDDINLEKEAQKNTVVVNTFEIPIGTSATLPIELRNEKEISSLQFEIELPEGVIIEEDENGELMIELTERTEGFQVLANKQGENSYRISLDSAEEAAIRENEGAILNIGLEASETASIGDAKMKLTNINVICTDHVKFSPKDTIAVFSFLDNNKLVINDVSAFIATEFDLPIEMNNISDITALQFDMTLPVGISVSVNDKGRYVITKTSRDVEHTIGIQKLEGTSNSYRVMIYSADNEIVEGREGEILRIALTLAPSLNPGNYELGLENIILTDINETKHYQSQESVTITIVEPEAGDVNADREIDVADIVAVATCVLNNRQIADYPRADVNKDGYIDVADIVRLASIILNGGNAKPITIDPQ